MTRKDRELQAIVMANARKLIKANVRTSNGRLASDLFGMGAGSGRERCRELGLDPDSNVTNYTAMMNRIEVKYSGVAADYEEHSKYIIGLAAILVRGDALVELYEICEKQKTISTSKLLEAIDNSSEKLKDYSRVLRDVHNKLSGVQ